MYTEENEFNYNDYLEDNNTNKSNKKFFDFKFILKVIIVILIIILLIFLVFKLKNRKLDNNNNSNNIENSEIVFNDNIHAIQNAAYTYFFVNNNLPTTSKTISVQELMDNNYIASVKDYKNNACGYNISNATMIKHNNCYELNIYLACMDNQEEITYYYDLNGNCLNCNGESYIPVDDNQEEKEDNNNNNSTNDNNTPRSCGVYSAWTTVYDNNPDLDVETRTLVKGYKEIITYGEWSTPTTEKLTKTDTLEVTNYSEFEEVKSYTDWSSESTVKPENKEGREIQSRDVTTSYTTTTCTGGGTYTKNLTKWDNTANSCISHGIGNVVCTYTKPCTNKTTTSYRTITYYKYRDTVITNVVKVYYKSRTINRNTDYTDYILESDMPDGYTKLNGSEIVQYRYREKCVK